ncbi:MAG TPA: 4-alpha-glucanotransferase [Candidatus Limnocylindria bacterium]|nr:4-alpha-glucanotransferase [Candidatus Limnocylindria bacterium]
MRRSSGILLPVASLPGGRLDREAHRFVERLAKARQSWWQVLPLNPPDALGSPYSALSAFAAHPGYLAEPTARVTAHERRVFRERNAYWLPDWLRYAGQDALDDQVRFDREWRALRRHATARGVRIMGDMPIFIAAGSADHLAHPELFQRGAVAGVPPDYFSRTGQLWGNPLYDWSALRRTGYRWWIERLRRALALYDVVRVDHFRGFVAYWSVRAGARDARRGRWRRGPGAAPFRAAERELGRLAVVAEDLGVITPAVQRLRDALGFPGMRVAQFAYGDARSPHRVERHPRDVVAYTGTHDNDTALGWWRSLDRPTRERTGLPGREPGWELIELVWSSRADVAIAPLQDVLGLGTAARVNRPGRARGNWRWRMRAGSFTAAHARRLAAITERARRAP